MNRTVSGTEGEGVTRAELSYPLAVPLQQEIFILENSCFGKKFIQ